MTPEQYERARELTRRQVDVDHRMLHAAVLLIHEISRAVELDVSKLESIMKEQVELSKEQDAFLEEPK